MKLTQEELKYIKPGIYRTWLASFNPPDLNNPKDDRLIKELEKLSTSADLTTGKFKDFYASPEEFLDAWIQGYKKFPNTASKWEDKSYLNPRAKGFELFYVNWHTDDQNFSTSHSN